MSTTSGTIKPSAAPLVTWEEQPLLQIRKLVLTFLQGLFEQQTPGCFQWVENLEETEIVITDEAPIKLEVVGVRPAISTVRGTVQWGQTSLDEKQSYNMATEQRTHTDLLRGSLSINCCSRVDLESEYIAWIVANHMWLLRRLLMKFTPVHEIGRGNAIGSPSPAGAIVSGDSEGEWINTVVTIPFFLQVGGKVRPLNVQLLKRIEAKLGVRGFCTSRTETRIPLQGTAAFQGKQKPPLQGQIKGPSIGGKCLDVAFEQSLNTADQES